MNPLRPRATNTRRVNLTLFRFIGADTVEWLSGDRLVHGQPADLAARAGNSRLVLVVPGEAVTLLPATLPPRNRATWLKALPYALEDFCAEDVDALHFAVGEARPGEATAPVAVVSHAKLRAWLETCTHAGLTLTAVVPDLWLVPWTGDAWSVVFDGERALVRHGTTAGFATTREQLTDWLTLALAEMGETGPRRLNLWGDPPPGLPANVDIQRQAAPTETLRVLADAYTGAPALNLLQGPYGRRARLGKWLRPWRAAAILAGLWIAALAGSQVGEYWQLSRDQTRLRADMERVYRAAVPDARRIVNPRAQLENRLRELRQAMGAADTAFLDLLYRGGGALVESPDIRLRALRYKDNQLEMELEGRSLEALDQLKQRLGPGTGLDVQVRSSKREDRVESQLTLRQAAP